MVCNHPLSCQNQVIWEGRRLPFPRSEASPCLLGRLLVVDKWNPYHCWKDMISANPVVFFISCKGLCTQFEWLNLEFQFMATPITSMATKSSDLEDQTSRTNLQTEGHTSMSSRGQKDPEEMGATGSAPSHLPSWSLTRNPSPSHPNTRHCLGIHMTLTKETGATPPPPHAWTVPLVEDMLCHGRAGLTEPVVMAPVGPCSFMGDGHWERAWA